MQEEMSVLEIFFFLLSVLFVAVLLWYFIYSVLYIYWVAFFASTAEVFIYEWNSFRQKYFPKAINPAYKKVIETYFEFYWKLSEVNKRKFEDRLMIFLSCKKIIPKEMPEVTEEMKVLISASAIQLTFGLRKFRLPSFHRIIVYPETYYSTQGKKYHKGEVNEIGIIVLSWANFLKGYIDKTDGINLGLHEMAHALKSEFIRKDFNSSFYDDYMEWEELAKYELEAIRKGENIFLRRYGGTNIEELFAVSVEYFFEKTEEFQKRMPTLYNLLKEMLNQDPIKN